MPKPMAPPRSLSSIYSSQTTRTISERVTALTSADCITCDADGCLNTPTRRCCRCRLVYYCSRECQKKDWRAIVVEEEKEEEEECRGGGGGGGGHREVCHKYCQQYKECWEKRTVEAEKGNDNVSNSNESSDNAAMKKCCICLSRFVPVVNPSQTVQEESCNHAICTDCLTEWDRHTSVILSSPTKGSCCPVCRITEAENIDEAILDRARLTACRASRLKAAGEKYLPDIAEEKRRGTVDMARRCWLRALKDVEKFLRSTEAPPVQAFGLKYQILLNLNMPEAALVTIDRMIRLDDERHQEAAKAKALFRRYDAAKARGDFDVVEVLERQLEELKVKMKNWGTRMAGEGPARHTILHLDRARAFQAQKRWECAIETYVQVLKSASADMNELSQEQKRTVLLGYSMCMYELGEYDTSIKLGYAAVAISRHHPEVFKYIALSQKAKGDIDDAIITLTKAAFYESPWDDENRAKVLELYDELVASKPPKSSIKFKSIPKPKVFV